MPLTADEIIQTLQLIPHQQGSFFKETFRDDGVIDTQKEGCQRSISSCVYILHTKERPMTRFLRLHTNAIHFFHCGSPLCILCIDENGKMEKHVLGNDIARGQRPQVLVKAGYWKAMYLEEGDYDYSFISETVAPGFDMRDMDSGTADVIQSQFPHLWEDIKQYCL
ncbi:uncharacterized protein TRIADDRAFT_58537 [Trichoplax adhaerens]|uniref:DUF985 domain-containing protein n=1 Tax=Trichoplax adhaerens TaxID=10228 RepID=B3S2Z2_TRIAD|nr:hypothetical protein TRIADDRAFT_58537 [Trichoplax adhaerens]EDV22704.1 hypothetical protein TRIADDRAFT_58537 [Trichoplax adhaerens]|eukprot:XP_002114570.1 hypothetical protein TRIADDRAFT_58537 [Trichoplax adhaerens]